MLQKQPMTKYSKNNRQNYFLFIATIFFAFGVFTAPWEGHEKWIWRCLVLYSLPLLCMLFQSTKTQEIGIIIGLSMGLQTFISPIFLNYYQDIDLITLKKNNFQTINIPKGVYPGLYGLQESMTDQKGYRVTKTIDYENKPIESFRIFTIGASTTEGYPALGNQNNWPHLLQEKLNQALSNLDVEVINAGLSATTINHQLATFKKVLSYSPNMVIFLIGINDWNHHIKLSQDNRGWLKKFVQYDDLEERVVLAAVDAKYNIALSNFRDSIRFDHTILAELIKRFKSKMASNKPKETTCGSNAINCGVHDGSYLASQMGGLNRGDKRNFRPQTVFPYYTHYLEKIGSICKSNEVDCIFMTQPTAYHLEAEKEIRDRLWMVPPNRDYALDFSSMVHIAKLYNNHLIGFAKENKFSYCDLASQMRPSVDNFVDDCHFNLLGAKNVADFVSSCVVGFKENS
jgi:lysophospholipase L1-like esterase